jgi:hypothetical protein
LRAQPGILAVDSFVVVNLTPKYNLRSLIAGYNKGQKNPTTPLGRLWDKYTVVDINRRTVLGQSGVEPTPGEIRIHKPTAPENAYNEYGLAGTGKHISEQRVMIGSRAVLNLTDYVILQKLRQAEGHEPLDELTFTFFPQMDFHDVDGGWCVGGADWRGNCLCVSGSYGFSRDQDGFRFSDGALEQ